MSIVSSTYALEGVQADGRTAVVERHVDSVGVTHRRFYLAEPGANYQAIADAAAEQLAVALAEAEAGQIIGG